MGKQKTNSELDKILASENIVEKEVSEEMERSYLSYAVMTILDRAIPRIEDGMKPVQRRVLYSMYDLGIKPEGGYKKSARIVGDVIGKYHPHGDTGTYGALTNLVNDFDIRYPLINGQGNFGSEDGDGPAAMRYTEAKLQKLAMENLRDLDCDAVDMIPNFSEDELEPEVLPGMVPNLLLNGAEGIATGYTTAIPSHNLIEISDGIIATIKNENISIEELVEKYIQGPDLPSYGYLIKNENILNLYKTGTGTLEFTGNIITDTNEENGNNQVVITELPPDMKKPKLLEKLHSVYIASKEKKVVDVRDESDKDGTRIVLELHKTTVPELIINDVYKYITKTKSYILRAIVNQTPTLLDLKEIILHYRNHRRNVIERRTRFNSTKLSKKVNVLEGFNIVLPHIKKVSEIIIDSKDRTEAAENLIKKFKINKEQAEAILEKKLGSLTKMEKDKIIKDLEDMKKELEGYQKILSSEKEIDKEIIKELNYLKKTYGDERKTKITEAREMTTVVQTISDEPMFIALTQKNQIKTMPYTVFENMLKNKSFKEKTNIFTQGIKGLMTDTFILILEDGTYIKCGFSNLESDIVNGKKIIGIIPNVSTDEVLVLMSKNGFIKKVKINSLKSKDLKITSLMEIDQSDKLIGIRVTEENDNNVVTLATKNGIVHRFYLRGFSVTSQTAKPLGCINLEENDNIVDFDINSEEGRIILFSKHNSGKYSWKSMKIDEFIPKNRMARGSSGIKYYKKDMGEVTNLLLVNKDFFMIGLNGEMILQRIDDLNITDKLSKPEEINFSIITSKFLL